MKLITLTDLGWQGKTEIDAISTAMVELMYGGLTETERDQLDELLTRVLHNVSTYESEEQEHD